MDNTTDNVTLAVDTATGLVEAWGLVFGLQPELVGALAMTVAVGVAAWLKLQKHRGRR